MKNIFFRSSTSNEALKKKEKSWFEEGKTISFNTEVGPTPRIYDQHAVPKVPLNQQKTIKIQQKPQQALCNYAAKHLQAEQKASGIRPLYRTTALEQKLMSIHRRHTYAFDSLPAFKPYKKNYKGKQKVHWSMLHLIYFQFRLMFLQKDVFTQNSRIYILHVNACISVFLLLNSLNLFHIEWWLFFSIWPAINCKTFNDQLDGSKAQTDVCF